MDIIERLMNFSLTRQEALIYITLHAEGTLTGYEVSKLSGISRSNSYTALASLVEKGAANIVEDTAVHYVPVEINEFCENKIRALIKAKDILCESVPKTKNKIDGYITIKGQERVFDKAISLIISAKERIYISVNALYLETLSQYLQSAEERGLKVVVITNPPFKMDGVKIYLAQNTVSQIRLIVDSTDVLTGDITENKSCLYSKESNLVDLFKQTLKNEIRLIELNEL